MKKKKAIKKLIKIQKEYIGEADDAWSNWEESSAIDDNERHIEYYAKAEAIGEAIDILKEEDDTKEI